MIATFAVIGVPVIAVSILHATGIVTSTIALIAASVVLSVGASYLGARIWATRKGSGDMLFADLMIWGWLRRWFLERQLSSAVKLLGLREAVGDAEVQLSSRQRVRLLKQLATGLEARHPDTHGHSRRVARHAATIAKRMGLESDEVARIRTAATVHDVGKVDIPSSILNKPDKLTADEFAAVKKHAVIGARMVTGLGDEELTRIVRHHHERLDGAGYPDSLSGTRIPLGARIIAVADTFDAITSTRPYRQAMRHRDALTVLAAESGTQLDAQAVRAFRRYYSGHRPVALWAFLVNGSRQLLTSLAAEVKLGGAVTAIALASVAAGDVAVNSLQGDARPVASQALGVSATLPGDTTSSTAGNGQRASDGVGKSDSRSGVGESGEPAANDPEGGAGSGSGDGASTDDPGSSTGGGSAGGGGGSATGGGGSGGSGSGESGGSGSGGGPTDDAASGEGNSASQVVSDVTAPVNSTVDTVVGKVDSVVKTVESTSPVKVTVPEVDVGSVLPKLPGK